MERAQCLRIHHAQIEAVPEDTCELLLAAIDFEARLCLCRCVHAAPSAGGVDHERRLSHVALLLTAFMEALEGQVLVLCEVGHARGGAREPKHERYVR